MSGTGDDRWRVHRGQSNSAAGLRQQRGGPAGRDKSSGLSSQESGQTAGAQSSSAGLGNAWSTGDRAGHAGSSMGPVEDRHVSVGGFDGQEARQLLRKGYQESMSQEEKPVLYKASAAETMKAKTAGPWGSKPNHMANGQDFFVQLRKGMAALQHSATQSSTS